MVNALLSMLVQSQRAAGEWISLNALTLIPLALPAWAPVAPVGIFSAIRTRRRCVLPDQPAHFNPRRFIP